MDQDTNPPVLTTTNTTPQLMQLGQTKTLGILYHHHRGIWNINTHLDHRSTHQKVYLIPREGLHNRVFFIGLHTTMKQGGLKPLEALLEFLKPFCGGFQINLF